jgi:ABC-type multidrug transport system fused ATPase/permease subunit
MLAQALLPWAIGRGVDGIGSGDTDAALRWGLVITGLGVVQAASGVARHRAAVANWIYAAFRTIQVITRHTARTGPAVRRAMPTGEVVATVSSDAMHIGHAFETLPRFAGAVVSYLVVSVIVIRTSLALGLMVLIGVPVLVAAIYPLVRPFQQRQRAQREALGTLTSLGADTVAGLRVLRGIGGENVFAARYRERSLTVRRAGERLAGIQALLDAFLVLLPGVFLALLTWVGARAVLDGTVGPGTLVALYGYAFFLLIPVRTAGEMAFILTRATVAARRVLALLDVERDIPDAAGPGPVVAPDADADHLGGHLADRESGLSVEAGSLTMVVSDDPASTSRLADRLGRLVATEGVTLDGVPVDHLPLAEVRRRVVISDPEPTLFTGTLRSGLDPFGRHTDDELAAAMSVAAASDVLETLRDGFDSMVEERGRSLSGGQRQRVSLARVLVADPEILVLVEPTSAVDAHTEAAIAANLRTARAGKTTVVVTASPLLLAKADAVAWVVDDRVAQVGTHDELLATTPAYRYTVTREEHAA